MTKNEHEVGAEVFVSAGDFIYRGVVLGYYFGKINVIVDCIISEDAHDNPCRFNYDALADDVFNSREKSIDNMVDNGYWNNGGGLLRQARLQTKRLYKCMHCIRSRVLCLLYTTILFVSGLKTVDLKEVVENVV